MYKIHTFIIYVVNILKNVIQGWEGGSLPWWLSGKEFAWNAGHDGRILGLGRSPGEENGNPLQYCCLENPMDRRARRVTVHGVAESQMWLNSIEGKDLHPDVLLCPEVENVRKILKETEVAPKVWLDEPVTGQERMMTRRLKEESVCWQWRVLESETLPRVRMMLDCFCTWQCSVNVWGIQ